MISKLFASLYAKVFVNIVVEGTRTLVYVEVCSKKRVEHSVHKYFDTTSVNVQMHDFIAALYKESPFCYISLLDNSQTQGALPTCSVSEMGKYCDINTSEYRCYDDNWAFYTSEYDLEALKQEYGSVGVDFIFSPFALLTQFFKDKIGTTLSLFVLVQEGGLAFGVFDHAKLLYGEYLSMQKSKERDTLVMDASMEEILEDQSDLGGINLEEVAIEDDSSGFEDFATIEDLEQSVTLEEFSESVTLDDEPLKGEQHLPSEGFNEDYQRFILIQGALNTFYKDPKYKSQFVESIYIADGVGVSSDLKSYLEQEIFLTVFVRKIDLGAALCSMAKAEV